MIKSMTGYGRAEIYKDDLIIETEIKSLNSRFLDISVKLPKSFSSKEFEIRDILRSKFNRGKIGLYINIKKDGVNGKGSFIDVELLKSVVESLKLIKNTSKVEEEISLNHILSLQGLFITDNNLNPDEEFGLIKSSINEAIKNLISMREKEGVELANDIRNRLTTIDKIVDEILEQNKSSIEENYSKFYDKAQKLTEDFVSDKERFNTELAILVEKYDLTEECVRLKSHLKLFEDTIKKGYDAGRKLNFICQEMNREANTINSKTVSSVISHNGIIIKEELEKIREQVQNIE